MQIIIVGCGKVGSTLAEQLCHEDHDICVIDTDAGSVDSVSGKFDVMGINGNGASYTVLKEAGIETAHLLIAVTDSDELNLLCCLIAKKAGNNCHTIARVRNPIYNRELDFIKEEMGISMIINPEYAAATEIARILRFPSAIDIDTFSKGQVELLKFRLLPGVKLAGCRVMDIHAKFRSDILVCGVEREGEVYIPDGKFELLENDLISIVASPVQSGSFFRKIGLKTNQVRSAMLLGGGKISFYLAEQLIKMNISVKIIELDRERCERLSELLPQAVIINGDATDRDVLNEEGMLTAGAFVALTNMDEENILLSLHAKSCCNAKRVAKINKISFDSVVNQLDIGSIVYPKYITAEYILQYVRAMQNSIGSNVETLYKILDNRAEALEFLVSENSPVVGIPLEKLKLKSNLLICSITHKRESRIPRGYDSIAVGDTVVVVTTNQRLFDIKDILEE